MSVVTCRATIECDGCGKQFHTEMDNAAKIPDGWSLFELATDYVRGGNCVEGGMSAVIEDHHLCPQCANVAAKVGPEDKGWAPWEEIREALDRTAY